MKTLYLLVPLAPLVGAIIAGFFGKVIGRAGAHSVTILGVAISFVLSVHRLPGRAGRQHFQRRPLHVDGVRRPSSFKIGFLIDPLTVMMMLVVTFVSLMVHIYTIGYMAHDEDNWPGQQAEHPATSASSATSRCSPSRC